MNKLVKKSLAGVLAGVMAATSLVGSITAFATISKEEAFAPKALTFGTAAVFEYKKDSVNQDVYYFKTAASTDSKIKTVDYNFTFASDAHLVDKTTTNERDDDLAVVSIYEYNEETKEVKGTPELTIEFNSKGANRYVASNRILFDKDDKQVSTVGTTYAYEATTVTQYALKEKTTYMAKVENYGEYTYKDANNKDQIGQVKASLTVEAYKDTKEEFVATADTSDPGYTDVKEAAGFNGTYYVTRTYGGAVTVKYNGDNADIVVPDTYKGNRVTGLTGVTENVAHSRITSITLGKNVKGVSGFGSSSNPFINLKSLTLNEGLTTIGTNAFSYCTGLTGQLVLPSTVKTIGAYAFYETGYESAKIQNKDTETIGAQAIGFAGILNEATANPTDTYPGVKKDFFILAPTGAKVAFEYGQKNNVPVIDAANCTHIYGDAEVKAATIYAAGSKTATCKVCGNVKTEAIAQKKVAIASVKSSKKGAITVKTKAVADKVTAYKVQYSTKKNFKGAKTVTVKTTKKALSKTITGLKAGKKYYVRVKAVNGKKTSAFSAKKSVTVKK